MGLFAKLQRNNGLNKKVSIKPKALHGTNVGFVGRRAKSYDDWVALGEVRVAIYE